VLSSTTITVLPFSLDASIGGPGGVNLGIPEYCAISDFALDTKVCKAAVVLVVFDFDAVADAVFEDPHAVTNSDITDKLHTIAGEMPLVAFIPPLSSKCETGISLGI